MAKATTGPVVIGIDIGTSSVKAVMTGPGGLRLGTYGAGYGTSRPVPGAAEQDPADWMRHVEAALAEFAGHPRAGDVVAIGVTSQVNTHVFCDEAGLPLGPAMTWQDTRPATLSARLDAAISPDAKIAALGAPIPIDASHALSRMAWRADTAPDVWAKTAHVLLPKDYVISRLTGQIAADPISAVGLVGTDMKYADPILDLMPRAERVLPPLNDPLDIVGRVRSGQFFAGTPVCAGTMDAWAGMFGLGVATEGTGFYLSGTSEVLGLVSEDGSGAPGIVTFPPWRGIRLHAGPTQSGGASLAWLAQTLGTEVGQLADLAAQAPISAQVPLFLPHLEGERAPLWDAASRGAFAGMNGATGPAEMAAAVMEGVAFSARMAIDAVERSGGQTLSRLRYGGGGAASATWGQIRATALGRTLDRVSSTEAGAVGAAVMAGVATGTLASMGAAADAIVKVDRTFEPDPGATSLADERYAAYCDLYQALGPINRKLAAADANARSVA